MSHVLETKRHYAQILRISGSDESEEVIPQSTPIAPYVQIGPKAALSYSDRMKAAKVEVEDSRNKVYTFFFDCQFKPVIFTKTSHMTLKQTEKINLYGLRPRFLLGFIENTLACLVYISISHLDMGPSQKADLGRFWALENF